MTEALDTRKRSRGICGFAMTARVAFFFSSSSGNLSSRAAMRQALEALAAAAEEVLSPVILMIAPVRALLTC